MHAGQKKILTIIIVTSLGDITAEFFIKQAPITVKNFLFYIEQNRYDECHFYTLVHSNNQPENKILLKTFKVVWVLINILQN